MGKTTGFIDYTRKTSTDVPPLERIENFNEFHVWLSREEQQTQAARCMDCGVPFCQAGMMIGGMASGCPLNNLIPEWNDLVYHGKWELALRRLATNRFPEFTSRVCPALCEGGLHLRRCDRQQRHRARERTRHYRNGLRQGLAARRTAALPHRQERSRDRQRPLRPFGGRIPEQARPRRDCVRACRPRGRPADVRHPQHEAGQIRHRAPHQDHAGEGVEFRTNMDVGGAVAAEDL